MTQDDASTGQGRPEGHRLGLQGCRLVYSLILPNYNPGAGPDSGLAKTWHALCEFISRQQASWEVLFVCDGSTDGSIDQLRQWCHDHRVNWCRVLSYTPNQGKGLAVRVGLEQARGDIRVFTDVDLAYSFEDLLQVVETVKRGADVAIASREHPQSFALLPMSMVHHVSRRRIQSHVFRSIARQMVRLHYVDTQAGLKAFTAQAARQLTPYLACKGFGFDCEVLLACQKLNLNVTEVPVTVRYQTAASTTSWKSSFQMMKQIWQIRQRWRHGIPAMNTLNVDVKETGWAPTAIPLSKAA